MLLLPDAQMGGGVCLRGYDRRVSDTTRVVVTKVGGRRVNSMAKSTLGRAFPLFSHSLPSGSCGRFQKSNLIRAGKISNTTLTLYQTPSTQHCSDNLCDTCVRRVAAILSREGGVFTHLRLAEPCFACKPGRLMPLLPACVSDDTGYLAAGVGSGGWQQKHSTPLCCTC